MTEGWDGLRDFDPANLKDTQHKQEDLDVAFVRCFETHEGQTVLAYLKRVTIDQPSWYPGEDPSHGFAREGQNSIVREILRRIERGKQ